jgi:hypothetical protein
MSDLRNRIDALDSELFSYVDAQTGEWDRRALLALHAAAADTVGSFAYLEIGSYLGGSLQALIRDPRCRAVISLDPRTVETPDDRGDEWVYEDNTTEHMIELLRGVPGADMAKLTTFEAGTDDVSSADLPVRPDYCLIDGEHTHDAVTRDARFCAEALNGTGVIAFHDYVIVGSAISAFVREHWREVSFALAFSGPSHPSYGGGVFALELGGGRLLRHPAIERAIGSRWHSAVWRMANLPRRTARPLLVAWATIPAIDVFVVQARHGFREYFG